MHLSVKIADGPPGVAIALSQSGEHTYYLVAQGPGAPVWYLDNELERAEVHPQEGD
jgi:hypothetical protein